MIENSLTLISMVAQFDSPLLPRATFILFKLKFDIHGVKETGILGLSDGNNDDLFVYCIIVSQ